MGQDKDDLSKAKKEWKSGEKSDAKKYFCVLIFLSDISFRENNSHYKKEYVS